MTESITQIMERASKVLMNTYGRTPVAFEKGEGCRVWDQDGRVYLDFLAGIAVTALGHSHPRVIERLQGQAGQLFHTSNLYYIEPQIALAEKLIFHSFADKVFFCNSGTEANEGAMKLARRYSLERFGADRTTIVCMINSFHGRTLGSLSATGQEKFQKGFGPLVPGISFVPFDDLSALDDNWNDTVCAVMLEPIQGEGGVRVPDQAFLKEVKKRCRERQALLVLDEVQTGLGRTGTLFAHEQFGFQPDIMTLAKALGNGLPIGALLATDEVAKAFQPGTHAATFGGNPLVTAVADTVLSIILEEGFLSEVKRIGTYFKNGLLRLQEKFPQVIVEVRGMGLLLGMVLNQPGKPFVEACLQKGFLINCTQETILRFTPPLIIKEEAIDALMNTLENLFEELPA
ncbi:MAG: acetylornithine transaminase [Desulfobacca sp.]|nr:acetylornithine transaminase [Desulfobacca sp.]